MRGKKTKFVQMPCVVCGTVVEGTMTAMSKMRKAGRAFCSAEHRKSWQKEFLAIVASKRTKKIEMKCIVCGVSVVGNGTTMGVYLKRGRAYCSTDCATKYRREHSRVRMLKWATENAQASSDRMKSKNPMRDPSIRAKVSQTLRAIGHAPLVRGGNGKGLTRPQAILLSALGDGWLAEFAISTSKGSRSLGYPSHYKADVAYPSLKIAVEVDGTSHAAKSRQAADARRDAYLAGLGWTTLRFSNQDAMERTTDCVLVVSSTISKLRGLTPTSSTV